jgi:hypoxanthine-DNA glycosylase
MSDDDVLLHGLAPIVNAQTRLLVLGSFPGVASLRCQQYYAYPRNQFWPIMGALLGFDASTLAYPQRLERTLAAGVGLWDVYAACVRPGSLDADIRHAQPNDLGTLITILPVLRVIAHNGGESAKALPITRALAPAGCQVVRLPSTSPANASWHFERKLSVWREAFVTAKIETVNNKQARRVFDKLD